MPFFPVLVLCGFASVIYVPYLAERYRGREVSPCWSYVWYMPSIKRQPVAFLMVLPLMTDSLVLKCQLLASFHGGAKDADECYAFTAESLLWSCI
jgi:hypothetical protein